MKRTLVMFLIILFAEMILGESRPSSQTLLIDVEVYDYVTLQCRLDSRYNMENYTAVCQRVDLNKTLHAYRRKHDLPHDQMDQYRGRTTLNPEDLSQGVLTLLISSVQTSDSGPYRCFVPKQQKSSCTFNLTVVRRDEQNKTKRDSPSTTRPPLEEVTKPDVSDGANMKAVRECIITTVVIILRVLIVEFVKSGTIQDCLKRLRVKKRTSNGSEERDEDQERPLETVV